MKARPAPLRVCIATSSIVESGSTIAYLLDTTPVRIDAIYFDTLQQFRRSAKTAAPQRRPWFRDRQLLTRHACLAGAMPRHYFFKAWQKAFHISEIEFLYKLERISPRLLERGCGFPLPVKAPRKYLLHKLPDVAAEHGIRLVRTPSLNNDETIAALADEAPDVVIGLGTRILSPRVLDTARIGFLNGHASLLPEYRGGTTEFWQLVHGEKNTGMTIHWMAPLVDEGAICKQKSWAIPARSNHHGLRVLSLFHGFDLWREVVERLLCGEMPGTAQGPARTPTFRAPSMKQQYDFYCRRMAPSP
jgi:hypothetical protein